MPVPNADRLFVDEAGPGNFFIDRMAVGRVEADGPKWKFDDMCHIGPTIARPERIYRGFKREEYQHATAYFSRPDPGGAFFVAYTNPISGGDIVFDWGWRLPDKTDPSQPQGWQDFESQER